MVGHGPTVCFLRQQQKTKYMRAKRNTLSSSLASPLSHLFLLYFILRSLLPVYPPRRRLVSVLPSLPLYWDAKREQCRSLNLFSVGNSWQLCDRAAPPVIVE